MSVTALLLCAHWPNSFFIIVMRTVLCVLKTFKIFVGIKKFLEIASVLISNNKYLLKLSKHIACRNYIYMIDDSEYMV